MLVLLYLMFQIYFHINTEEALRPRTRTVTYGPRSFAVSGPNVWNTLPSTLCVSITTLGQFQSGLKTMLFHLAYHINILTYLLLVEHVWNYYAYLLAGRTHPYLLICGRMHSVMTCNSMGMPTTRCSCVARGLFGGLICLLALWQIIVQYGRCWLVVQHVCHWLEIEICVQLWQMPYLISDKN